MLQGKRLCWGGFVSCPKPHGVAFREKLSNLDCLRFLFGRLLLIETGNVNQVMTPH